MGKRGTALEDLNYGPSVSFMLTRPSFPPCFVRGATHTTVQAHRRAVSASPRDTAAVTGPSYPGDRRRRAGEPRRAPHDGLRSGGRGSQAQVGPRIAMKRKRWRPQSPRLRCSAAPRRPRPPPLQRGAEAAGSHDTGATATGPDPLTSRGDGAEPCTEAMYRSTSALLRLIAPRTRLPRSGRPALGPTATAGSRR